MNEATLNTIYDCFLSILFLLRIAVSAYCLHRFLQGFFIPIKKTAYTLIPPFSYFVVMLILKLIPTVINTNLAYAIGTVIAIALSFLVYSKGTIQRIYIGITFFLLCYFCSIVSSFGYSFSYWLSTTLGIQTTKDALIFLIINELICLPFYYFTLLTSVKVIVKHYDSNYSTFTLTDVIFLVLPGITCVINRIFISQIITIYEKQTESSISFVQSVGIFSFFSSLFFILLIVVSFVFFQNLMVRKFNEKNNLILERDIHNLKSHISDTEKLYLEIKGFKHDFKNHISNLESLIKRKEYFEVYEYIHKTQHLIDIKDYAISTGNPVTDAIINQVSLEASSFGIPFESKLVFPSNSGIDSFDLGILLSNALKNAIEAALKEEHPFINISSFTRNNMYLIEVRNSFSRVLKLNAKGLPITTKTEIDHHGFGLLNISQIAQKYTGDIDITTSNQEFELTVMLYKTPAF